MILARFSRRVVPGGCAEALQILWLGQHRSPWGRKFVTHVLAAFVHPAFLESSTHSSVAS